MKIILTERVYQQRYFVELMLDKNCLQYEVLWGEILSMLSYSDDQT